MFQDSRPTTGTPKPFVLVKDIDVSLKGGTSFGIYTTLHCITAMREYKQKSLEELRYEDYCITGLGTRLKGNRPTTGIPKPFLPTKGTDTHLKSGASYPINTILYCITAMKEYEQKSLEELRYEDYCITGLGNRLKGLETRDHQDCVEALEGLKIDLKKPRSPGLSMRSDASLYVRSGFGTRLGMGLGRGTKLQIQGMGTGGLGMGLGRGIELQIQGMNTEGLGMGIRQSNTNDIRSTVPTTTSLMRQDLTVMTIPPSTSFYPFPPQLPSSSTTSSSSYFILTNPQYYTIPPINELQRILAKTGTCVVEDFVIGRHGFGKIFFPGQTDLAGLNLDELVIIENCSVTVYPDSCSTVKPPVGQGLNKTARVRLERFWQISKANHKPIKDPEVLEKMDFVNKLKKSIEITGARFIDYSIKTGTCCFEVDHFSEYILCADSEEDIY